RERRLRKLRTVGALRDPGAPRRRPRRPRARPHRRDPSLLIPVEEPGDRRRRIDTEHVKARIRASVPFPSPGAYFLVHAFGGTGSTQVRPEKTSDRTHTMTGRARHSLSLLPNQIA